MTASTTARTAEARRRWPEKRKSPATKTSAATDEAAAIAPAIPNRYPATAISATANGGHTQSGQRCGRGGGSLPAVPRLDPGQPLAGFCPGNSRRLSCSRHASHPDKRERNLGEVIRCAESRSLARGQTLSIGGWSSPGTGTYDYVTSRRRHVAWCTGARTLEDFLWLTLPSPRPPGRQCR